MALMSRRESISFMDDYWRSNRPKSVTERVGAMVKLCRGRVLDVGCGKGQYAHLLGDWVGVDYSIEGLKSAKGDRVQADVEHLPFRDRCIDTYFGSELLEHVVDDVKAVEEAKRVLRPDGILIASTPNSIVRKEYWSQWVPSKSDKREYTPDSFVKTLGENVKFHNYCRGDPTREVWLVASLEMSENIACIPVPMRLPI